MRKYVAALGEELTCVPLTFVVSAKLQIGKEKERLLAKAQAVTDAGKGRIWIVKPDGRNRGVGITVVDGIGAPCCTSQQVASTASSKGEHAPSCARVQRPHWTR